MNVLEQGRFGNVLILIPSHPNSILLPILLPIK